ncbi:hypothetical protein K443DRAFT_492648 [Laccaria amethystina LaAM-08-1]|uniref:Unplaced genomic scaffold K443scaffold_498, whole genome shotgun sequence n=1 Tax=Laccaria amethystina LaAM-08-1 TaxID=1095629 RepID=A0A0C9WSW3_9AGAR|nr:hypothetical protein K443DRAFT_492648 [Laccaria amethystina LaAM-08-1]
MMMNSAGWWILPSGRSFRGHSQAVKAKTPESLLARSPQRAPLCDIFALFLGWRTDFIGDMQQSQHHRSEVYLSYTWCFSTSSLVSVKAHRKRILQHRTLDFDFPYDQFDGNLPVPPQFGAFEEQSC